MPTTNPATSLAQDERIPGLPDLPANTDRATLSLPVYNPATDRTHQMPVEAPGTLNSRLGGFKSVIFLTSADALSAGWPQRTSLDQIDPLSVCPGTLAYVALYPGRSNTFLVAVYDDGKNPAALRFRGYYDGRGERDYKLSPIDGLLPIQWVLQDSPEALTATIRRWSGAITNWGQDENMKIQFGSGADSFFTALNPGGPFTAPLSATDDTNPAWRPAAPPTAPAALSRVLPLDTASYLAHHPEYAGTITSGRTYDIVGPWNGGAADQIVSVVGTVTGFATYGKLFKSGVGTTVQVDVAAGTAMALGGASADDLQRAITTLPLRPVKSADTILTAADIGALVPVNSSAAINLTIPVNMGLPAPAGADAGAARVCYPLQLGNGVLRVVADSGVTLIARPGGGFKSPGKGGRVVLIWLDSNTVLVEGGVV